MAMQTGQADDGLIGQINTTPLVDVMLVLLIIFLITVPVVSNAIRLNLPNGENSLKAATTQGVTISVDARGAIWFAGQPVPSTPALVERVLAAQQANPQATFEIHGDRDSRFAPVGRVLFALQKVGVSQVEFVIQPGH